MLNAKEAEKMYLESRRELILDENKNKPIIDNINESIKNSVDLGYRYLFIRMEYNKKLIIGTGGVISEYKTKDDKAIEKIVNLLKYKGYDVSKNNSFKNMYRVSW